MNRHTTNHVFLVPSITPEGRSFMFVESSSYHDVMNDDYKIIAHIDPLSMFALLDCFNFDDKEYVDTTDNYLRLSVRESSYNGNYVNMTFREYDPETKHWRGVISVTTYRVALVNALRVALTQYLKYNEFDSEEPDIDELDMMSEFFAIPITSQMIDDLVYGSNE